MSVEQAFSYGFALAGVLAGAGYFGWDNAMKFGRKLERHGVQLSDWHADKGEQPQNVATPFHSKAG